MSLSFCSSVHSSQKNTWKLLCTYILHLNFGYISLLQLRLKKKNNKKKVHLVSLWHNFLQYGTFLEYQSIRGVDFSPFRLFSCSLGHCLAAQLHKLWVSLSVLFDNLCFENKLMVWKETHGSNLLHVCLLEWGLAGDWCGGKFPQGSCKGAPNIWILNNLKCGTDAELPSSGKMAVYQSNWDSKSLSSYINFVVKTFVSVNSQTLQQP